MGGTHPRSLSPNDYCSEIVQDYIKKIPTFIAFFKLLLGHAKVTFIAFFGGFLDASPPVHWLTPSVLGKWKVLGWYISGPSFIYVWFVVPKFSNVKRFSNYLKNIKRKAVKIKIEWTNDLKNKNDYFVENFKEE